MLKLRLPPNGQAEGGVEQRQHEADKLFRDAHIRKESRGIFVRDRVKCPFTINRTANGPVLCGPRSKSPPQVVNDGSTFDETSLLGGSNGRNRIFKLHRNNCRNPFVVKVWKNKWPQVLYPHQTQFFGDGVEKCQRPGLRNQGVFQELLINVKHEWNKMFRKHFINLAGETINSRGRGWGDIFESCVHQVGCDRFDLHLGHSC